MMVWWLNMREPGRFLYSFKMWAAIESLSIILFIVFKKNTSYTFELLDNCKTHSFRKISSILLFLLHFLWFIYFREQKKYNRNCNTTYFSENMSFQKCIKTIFSTCAIAKTINTFFKLLPAIERMIPALFISFFKQKIFHGKV